MIDTIKNLFGLGPKTDYEALLKQGAIILDVRSRGEYLSGHIKGSVNVPLDQLGTSITALKNKSTPIITCCASGMRSATAKSILLSKGYQQVYNGGGWTSLQNRI